jgi:hypothetical protein
VLQTIHHEPAVRHAAIALGSLHETFTLHDSTIMRRRETIEEENFALGQYVKALGSLLEPAKAEGKQAADVALMTCVLFVCFETLRGNHGAALKHVDAGVKILSELSSARTSSNLSISTNPYISLSTLNRIFIRLETQAGTITFGTKRQLVSLPHNFEPDGYEEEIPSSFTNTEEARNALEYIRILGSQAPRIYFRIGEHKQDSQEAMQAISAPFSIPPFVKKPPPLSPLEAAKTEVAIELIRSSAALRLRQWSAAFESFLASHASQASQLDPINKSTIALVKLHKITMEISFKIDYWRAVHDETVWDELLPDFAQIVDLAEEFVITSSSSLPRTKPPHSTSRAWTKADKQAIFNLDIGLIVPLYFVIGKCRDSRVRRKGISLLRSSERQEGVSNSFMVARVAERLVEIEEDGLLNRDNGVGEAREVDKERRVSGVEIKFLGDEEGGMERRARVRYRVPGAGNGKERMVEEWIEW